MIGTYHSSGFGTQWKTVASAVNPFNIKPGLRWLHARYGYQNSLGDVRSFKGSFKGPQWDLGPYQGYGWNLLICVYGSTLDDVNNA